MKHAIMAALLLTTLVCTAAPVCAETVEDKALGVSFDLPRGYSIRHLDAHAGPLPFLLLRKGGSEIKIMRLTTLLPSQWNDSTLRAATQTILDSYDKSKRGTIEADWRLKKLSFRDGWQTRVNGIDNDGNLIDGGVVTLLPGGEVLYAVMYFDLIENVDNNLPDYDQIVRSLELTVVGRPADSGGIPRMYLVIGLVALLALGAVILLWVRK